MQGERGAVIEEGATWGAGRAVHVVLRVRSGCGGVLDVIGREQRV
jgi:hypothetical protein